MCCYRLNCIPQKDMLNSQPLVPVNVILFGSNASADVIKIRSFFIKVALIQLETDTKVEYHVMMETETGVVCLHAKDCW